MVRRPNEVMSDMQEVNYFEIDSLIAKHIFGWKGKPFFEDWDMKKEFPRIIPSGKRLRTHEIDKIDLPRFSRNIFHAWSIVELLSTFDFSLTRHNQISWVATFYEPSNQYEHLSNNPALAICVVALKTKGIFYQFKPRSNEEAEATTRRESVS